jgi:hypothetical protein
VLLLSVIPLLVTTDDDPSSLILSNLMTEAISYSETLVLTRAKRRHIPEGESRFSINGVFCVVTPCGSCKNRRFGGTWRLLHQGDKNR